MSDIYMIKYRVEPDRPVCLRKTGMLVRLNQPLLTPIFFSLSLLLLSGNAALAETIKTKRAGSQMAALDPSVIDPVGKLAEISASVSRSSSELTAISKALDKLNDELAQVEKEKPGKVTKASFEALQKRYNDTIARSYIVEKRVKDSLAKSQLDIGNVHRALKAIQSERVAGSTHKPVMTDAEISECLKDLDDERATIKALQQSLVDDEARPAEKVADKDKVADKSKAPNKKNP
jgi:chromosome segregation ATPase